MVLFILPLCAFFFLKVDLLIIGNGKAYVLEAVEEVAKRAKSKASRNTYYS